MQFYKTDEIEIGRKEREMGESVVTCVVITRISISSSAKNTKNKIKKKNNKKKTKKQRLHGTDGM